MYSIESIKKVTAEMKARRAFYEDIPVEEIKLCISEGNRKIGKTINVSLPPILTCAHCKECMFYCYDIKACLQYPNTVIDARIRNLVILMKNRNEYFNRIENRIARKRKNKAFRWHVSGDIPDIDYLDRMVSIARRHPDWTFWTYTKNYECVNEYVRSHGNDRKTAIPANLSIMFSEWKGLTMLNPYGFAEFRVLFEDDTMPEGAWKCPGNCDACLRAGRGCPVNETGYVDAH